MAVALALNEIALVAVATLRRLLHFTVWHVVLPFAIEDSSRFHDQLACAGSLPLVKFTFINVAVRVDVFSLTMRYTILEVALVSRADRRRELTVAVALILVEFTLIYITLRSRELSRRGALAFLEGALVDGAVGESHLAWAVLCASIVGALEARSINMLLDAWAMWHAGVPSALVRHTALLHKLTLAVLLAHDELTLKDIAGRGNFTTRAIGDAFLPRAVVLLAVRHDHLALAMSLSVVELALVHVAVLERQLARTVRPSITLGTEINVTLCCLNLSGFFCHLSIF